MPIARRPLLAFALAASFLAPAGPAASAEAEAEVEAAVDALTAALLAPDAAALDALVLDGLSYGHSGGVVQDKAAFVDALTSRRSAFPSIVLSDRSVSIVGGDAIARHVFSGETTSGGRTVPVRIGVMQVWHCDGGRWRLLARQAYKI